MSNHTLFPKLKLTVPQMSVIHTLAIYRVIFSDRMDEKWARDYKRSIVALEKREIIKVETSDDGTFTVKFFSDDAKRAIDEFFFQKDNIRRGHLLSAGTPEIWENGIGAWQYTPQVAAVEDQPEAEMDWLSDDDDDQPEDVPEVEIYVDTAEAEMDTETRDEKWRTAERKAEKDMWCIDRYNQRYDNGAFCRMSAQLYAEMSDETAHQTIIVILDTALYLCGMNYRHYIEQSREWMKWSLEVKTSNEAFILARKFLGRFAEDDLIPF